MKVTQVRRMAQAKICFDGVKPMVLKLIGAQLFHQANASTFLLFIDQDSRAFPCDHA
jgi:hypothetical protein